MAIMKLKNKNLMDSLKLSGFSAPRSETGS